MKISMLVLIILSGLLQWRSSPAADFNGDGTNDIGIFRPASGLWAIRGITRVYFGGSADTPMPGDFNGTGAADIAIFRESSGLWAARNLTRVYFGTSGDKPLPAGGGSGGGGSLWGQNGSDIYYTGGNVGIGVSSPSYPLHIKYTHHGGWLVGIHNTGWSQNDYGLIVRADGGDPLWIQTKYGISALKVKQDGKVGIGMGNPAYRLDVSGDIRATGSVYYGGAYGATDGLEYKKPDFVFEESYRPLTTDQVEEHLRKDRSLPWITSVGKEEAGTVNMTRMSFETVETAENLQLQLIILNKRIKSQQEQIESQNRRIKALENTLPRSDQ